ncbi:MoxR family ATPase [Luedemannella flava]|uniref:MoxR family ATPase n=1 Tax=Luedemannella flava TaxID=349316 RepID=A0ABN2MKH4_9ACTN
MTVAPEATACTPQAAGMFAEDFARLVSNVELAVVGKTRCVRLALSCLFTGGHLLLEDVPGTGKTSLAKAIARSVKGEHRRVQFTPDLLPSDVTGGNVYNPQTGQLGVRRGPIFTNILLADEINRASPKTQSALLQAMEEEQVTIDGVNYSLDAPFMVIATQNPIEQAGTYPLPEAQLDRFLIRTELGYPDAQATTRLLAEAATRDRSTLIAPLITPTGVVDRARLVAGVHVDPAVLAYVSTIAEETRRAKGVKIGVSVRGCLSLVRLAKTWAAAQGRHYVLPDDVLDLAVPALAHRVVLDVEAEFSGTTAVGVIERVLSVVPAPAFRSS